MHVSKPEDITEAFVDAWMARDADRLAALFSEDADFVNVVGIWWEDRDAIRRAHHYGLTTFFANSTLKVGRIKNRLIGQTAAVVHARMILTGQTTPDGKPAGRRYTVLTFVLERDREGWVCVSAQNTDIVPGAETQISDGRTLTPKDYRI